MLELTECPNCGDYFEPRRKRQVYCCLECRYGDREVTTTPELESLLDKIIRGFCRGNPAMMREFRECLTDPDKFRTTLGEIRALAGTPGRFTRWRLGFPVCDGSHSQADRERSRAEMLTGKPPGREIARP